jgi:recombination protein RecA
MALKVLVKPPSPFMPWRKCSAMVGVAAFVDAEHALDPVYAKALGVDIDELLVSQPDTGEMGLEVVDQLVRSAAVDLVVVDSVAALVPRAEIEGEMGDAHVGLQARLMSQALRKITGSIGKSQCTVVFLNQLRQKIGISYGNPETTTGGNALKFYASVRLDIRRIQTLKKGTEEYGIRAKVKVAKNKVAPPFRIAEFDILFGQGISTLGCLLDLAEQTGVVSRRGAWYSYGTDNIGRQAQRQEPRGQPQPPGSELPGSQQKSAKADWGSRLLILFRGFRL